MRVRPPASVLLAGCVLCAGGCATVKRPSTPWRLHRAHLRVGSCVVIGVFAAYVAGRALPPGTDYLQVFRFVGATAFIGYSVALWQMSIWNRRAWLTTIKATVDGLIYALLTAGTFGWLWPRP